MNSLKITLNECMILYEASNAVLDQFSQIVLSESIFRSQFINLWYLLWNEGSKLYNIFGIFSIFW